MANVSIEYFRNLSSLDEPNNIGYGIKISYKQLIFFSLGVFPGIFIGMRVDVIVGILVAIPALLLALTSTKYFPIEKTLLHELKFLFRGTSLKQKPKKYTSITQPVSKKKKSKSQQLAKISKLKLKKPSDISYLNEITLDDFDSLARLSSTLFYKNNVLGNTVVSIFLDEEELDPIVTTPGGEFEIFFKVKTQGKKHLKIMANGIAEPVLEGFINIKLKRNS